MQVAAETLKALLAGVTSAQRHGPPGAPAAAALMRVLLPLLIQVTLRDEGVPAALSVRNLG